MAKRGTTDPDKGVKTSIHLTQEAMDLLDRYVKKRGGKGMRMAVLSRMIEWFSEQPEVVKSVVLGWVDEGMDRAYATTLHKLANDLEGKFTPPTSPSLGIRGGEAANEPGSNRLREQAGREAGDEGPKLQQFSFDSNREKPLSAVEKRRRQQAAERQR